MKKKNTQREREVNGVRRIYNNDTELQQQQSLKPSTYEKYIVEHTKEANVNAQPARNELKGRKTERRERGKIKMMKKKKMCFSAKRKCGNSSFAYSVCTFLDLYTLNSVPCYLHGITFNAYYTYSMSLSFTRYFGIFSSFYVRSSHTRSSSLPLIFF